MSGTERFPDSSRRDVLAAGVSLTGLGMSALLGGPARGATSARQTAARAQPSSDDDLLDKAFERITAVSNQSIYGSNHAAMVSEALATLGRGAAIAPWLDGNLQSSELDSSVRKPIDPDQWHESLAQPELYPAWRALFLDELESDDWKLVLRRWVPRLAPGLPGVATHGLIRTAHGARSLAKRDNAVRRGELATGLAYWAINYEELPWDGSIAAEKSVEAALARVEPRLPARKAPEGNIVTGLRALRGTPSFLPVAGLVDTSDPARTLSEITSAFARFYLRNPERRIAFTHSVTAPSALRLLAPYLDEETVRTATRFAWQAAAGIYVVYGDPRASAPAERAPVPREDLVARCVENGGAHSIKLTEACLREEALSHDPILFAAARDAGEAMHG
jgi:hypothetical protein